MANLAIFLLNLIACCSLFTHQIGNVSFSGCQIRFRFRFRSRLSLCVCRFGIQSLYAQANIDLRTAYMANYAYGALYLYRRYRIAAQVFVYCSASEI